MVKAELEEIAVAGEGNQFLMLLKTEQDDYIAMTIDGLQAQSIITGRMKEKFPRPLTHDLMLSVLEMLSATLLRVEVTDLNDHTYFARLVLESRGIEIEIDARPSDALALAVRTNAEIFIAEHVVEEAAMTDDFSGPGTAEA